MALKTPIHSLTLCLPEFIRAP